MTAYRVALADLPKPARERLVRSLSGDGPAPIVAERSSPAQRVASSALLAAFGLAMTGAMALSGFGHSVQALSSAVVYAAGCAGFLVGALDVAERATNRSNLPEGRYLFALHRIEVIGKTLEIVPIRDAELRIEDRRGGARVALTLSDGTRETFDVTTRDEAERAVAVLRKARAAEVDTGDPLADIDLAQTFATSRPPRSRAPIVAIVGVAIGTSVFALRNRASDERAFEAAVRANTEPAFEAYLETGVRHADDVRATLLPRAALAFAEKKGDIAKLRSAVVRFHGTPVEGDAEHALHDALGAAFDAFKDRAATSDPRLVPFVRKLFAWLEAKGPRLDVRVDAPNAKQLAMVDALLEDGKLAPGAPVVKVAPRFDQAHASVHEGEIQKAIASSFASIFPADVARVENSPEGEAAPSIDVRYRVGWGGDVYDVPSGDKRFVTITVSFDVAIRIPGDDDALTFTFSVPSPDDMKVAMSHDEGAVYDAMMKHAAVTLGTELAKRIARP